MSFLDYDFSPIENGKPTLHFCLISQAYFVDTDWGYGTPTKGVEKMGKLAHDHGIPITYLVTEKSASDLKDTFTLYHEKYGDEVQQQLRYAPKGSTHRSEREMIETASINEFKAYIQQSRKGIIQALPWCEPTLNIIGSGIRSENLVLAMQELGYKGLHGHCEFQLGVDNIISFATPWSSFYISPRNFQCPALKDDNGERIVALEWTARDLCKSWHYVATEIYSTDPNDVERGGICTDTNVEYWKELTREWLRNVPLNGDLFFQMHQESHEMDGRHEICHPFNPERVEFTYKMMDLYFKWLTSLPECFPEGNPETGVRIAFETASEHVENYRKRCASTPPSIMAYKEIDIPRDLPYWDQIKSGIGYCGYPTKHVRMPSEFFYEYIQDAIDSHKFDGAPWSDSICYYDRDCMLLFDNEGSRNTPIWAANYTKARARPNVRTERIDAEPLSGNDTENIEWFQEENLPEPSSEWDEETKILSVKVEAEKAVPWGAVFWEDAGFDGKTKVKIQSSDVPARSWLIDEKALLLRANLKKGVQMFKIKVGN